MPTTPSKIHVVHIEREGHPLTSKAFRNIKDARRYAFDWCDTHAGDDHYEKVGSLTRAGRASFVISRRQPNRAFARTEVLHVVIHRVTDPFAIRAYIEDQP